MKTQTLELKLTLSPEVVEYLQHEAQRRQLSLDDVVSEVVEDAFDEPTNEQILENIRLGMKDVLTGNYRPADEVLDEIKRELGLGC